MSSDIQPHLLAAAAVVPRRGRLLRTCRAVGFVFHVIGSIAVLVPLFAYLLLLYVGVKLYGGDVRGIAGTLYLLNIAWHVTWVELFQFFAALLTVCELLRVSKPGIDQTFDAIRMSAAGVLYLLLFVVSVVLAAAGVGWLPLFRTTEFGLLMLVALVTGPAALLINGRTLKRTIDYTAEPN